MSKATKDKPTRSGRYQARCTESNYEWYSVHLYRRADGVMMTNDEHIGRTGLDAYHEGLTELEWRKL